MHVHERLNTNVSAASIMMTENSPSARLDAGLSTSQSYLVAGDSGHEDPPLAADAGTTAVFS